eukprot:TRINITY_DN13961_c0_g1_i1.p1 TRINITY_DN13961_c0_g1~~TRINITY_DN13961_c0_g1_i1.p1  ORF type:complete len:231 (+),score=54.22 TRINITY_DN13961_c0_g1_i1:50-694(+)
MENSWLSLSLQTDDASLIKMGNWFKRLKAFYEEKSRYYHNISHVISMLSLLEEYRSSVRKPVHVALAIWFHDAIYDATKNDNEEKSVQLFEVFAIDLNLSAELTKEISSYIIATKSHKTNSENSENRDLAFFLDFDVSILGKEEEEYDQYSVQIRKEYSHVSNQDYRVGREKVLNSLSEGNVFATKEFRDRFEEKAKANMKREIQLLQSGKFDL